MSTALPSGAVPKAAFVTLGAVLAAVFAAALVAPLAAGLSALELGEQPMSAAVVCAAIATVQRRTFVIAVSARVGVRAVRSHQLGIPRGAQRDGVKMSPQPRPREERGVAAPARLRHQLRVQ